MSGGRVGGTIYFKVDGAQYKAKGGFSYNLGQPKREGVVGADGVHGYKESPQIPYVEGEITDSADLDVQAFLNLTGVTVTLELANGKTILVRDAWYAGEGKTQTDEGNIEVRFEGMSAEEVK
jgi:hypothetical protein